MARKNNTKPLLDKEIKEAHKAIEKLKNKIGIYKNIRIGNIYTIDGVKYVTVGNAEETDGAPVKFLSMATGYTMGLHEFMIEYNRGLVTFAMRVVVNTR